MRGRPVGALWVVVGLVGGIASGSVHADTVDPASAQDSEPALWIQGHFGLAFADLIVVDDLSLNTSEGVAPSVGVGMTYRLSRFDLGVVVEALGGGRFVGMTDSFRIGAQLRASAHFRWRFVHRGWGGMFLHLSPGWTMFSYSDAMRFQGATLLDVDLQDVAAVSHGFAGGFGVGLLVNVLYDVAIRVGLEVVMATGTLGEGEGLAVMRVRGLASVGLEWGQRL